MANQSPRPNLRAIPGGRAEGSARTAAPSRHNRPNRRGALLPLTAAMGTLIILGITGRIGHGNTVSTDKVPSGGLTKSQLEDWPKAKSDLVTVQQGQGADAIGAEVNPEIYSGPKSSAETSANMTAIIEDQADGEFLQPDQQVTVPDIHPNIPSANPDDPNIQPAG